MKSITFASSNTLQQHMYIHTGERPYTCDVCGRGFTQSHSLTFHARRHTGEKPFTCEKCGAMFRHSIGLKVFFQFSNFNLRISLHY